MKRKFQTQKAFIKFIQRKVFFSLLSFAQRKKTTSRDIPINLVVLTCVYGESLMRHYIFTKNRTRNYLFCVLETSVRLQIQIAFLAHVGLSVYSSYTTYTGQVNVPDFSIIMSIPVVMFCLTTTTFMCIVIYEKSNSHQLIRFRAQTSVIARTL